MKLWQYRLLILGSIWILIALFTGWLVGGVVGVVVFTFFDSFVKKYYYSRHPKEAKKVKNETLKKARVKTEKEYQEQIQKKHSKTFHSILMFFGAFFLSIVVAAIFNNLYIFWVVLIVCIFLILLRGRVRLFL